MRNERHLKDQSTGVARNQAEREVMATIEASGQALSETNLSQLMAAIRVETARVWCHDGEECFYENERLTNFL